MTQKRSRSPGYNQSTIPLANGGLNHYSKESSSGSQASRTYVMMIDCAKGRIFCHEKRPYNHGVFHHL